MMCNTLKSGSRMLAGSSHCEFSMSSFTCRRFTVASYSFSPFSVPSWANVDVSTMGKQTEPHNVCNLVNGRWEAEAPSGMRLLIPDPMNKNNAPIFSIPDTQIADLDPFVESMVACPKSGLHNPLKKNERYLMYGEISRRVGNS